MKIKKKRIKAFTFSHIVMDFRGEFVKRSRSVKTAKLFSVIL